MDLDALTRASLPAGSLSALGDLRARPDVSVLLEGALLWLRWELERSLIASRLLPIVGATLLERRDGLWFPAGRLLPVSDVPADDHPDWKPLAAVLLPARVEPDCEPLPEWETVALRLIPGEQTHPATALRATFAEVRAWSDAATNAEMGRFRAAWCGDEVLLLGDRPPNLLGGRRYHGQRVLLPLGFILSPALASGSLVEILGLNANEIALIDPAGTEILDTSNLTPLTRAALRRADILREDA